MLADDFLSMFVTNDIFTQYRLLVAISTSRAAGGSGTSVLGVGPAIVAGRTDPSDGGIIAGKCTGTSQTRVYI